MGKAIIKNCLAYIHIYCHNTSKEMKLMFFKATKEQTFFLLKKKSSIFVFYVLLIMVLINFVSNVLEFSGRDVTHMYHSMKILLLSYNRVNYQGDATLVLIQLYPLLVVLPAGFSLAKEYQSGQDVYMISRLGHRNYIFSKLLSAFLATMLIFVTPFLLELVLNCLSFPSEASGDMTNWTAYDENYLRYVRNYLVSGLYFYSPYLYALLATLLFGIVSGVLGMFSVAVSALVRIKYNIFLFLPVFVFLNGTVILANLFSENAASIRWYDYFFMFSDKPKNFLLFVFVVLVMILFSVGSVAGCRKDCI